MKHFEECLILGVQKGVVHRSIRTLSPPIEFAPNEGLDCRQGCRVEDLRVLASNVLAERVGELDPLLRMTA